MLTLDHLAVACVSLDKGTAWVERQLGVKMQPGGQHARYGTHNTLFGLADGLYLEVIAVEAGAVPEAGHTWFDLAQFSGPPRLANWICQTDDLDAAVAKAPAAVGTPQALTRGDLSWQITVPDDGSLPYDGAFPTLIKWAKGTHHPADRLPTSGCRLIGLEVTHPLAEQLRDMMALTDDRVTLHAGRSAMKATFDTPAGVRTL
ncbi:VOC family protein [Loktanella sp. Alg231-35]|uniref:VOC family protein n=1 Tax=Loktanella sp. Alg231-35 TaxID=1922220 RepID=UPI000D54E681|nr:VOC family protein [Loktanella sp. Alg231-35]